jgi:hypothetical protein
VAPLADSSASSPNEATPTPTAGGGLSPSQLAPKPAAPQLPGFNLNSPVQGGATRQNKTEDAAKNVQLHKEMYEQQTIAPSNAILDTLLSTTGGFAGGIGACSAAC